MKPPPGKTLYQPRGHDRLADTNNLADCIAASDAILFNSEGQAVWIHEGQCKLLSLQILVELIATYIVTGQPVQHEGSWTVSFKPVVADQAALHAMIQAKTKADGSLVARLPKVLMDHGLTWQQTMDVRARMQRGERPEALAREYGADAIAIRQLGQ